MRKNRTYVFIMICYTAAALLSLNGCEGVNLPTNPSRSSLSPTVSSPGPSTVKGPANSLFIPPILEDLNPELNKAAFEFTAKKGSKEFFPGKKTETYGYNLPYLGQTIRVKKGEYVNFKIKNSLPEETTVHWHGLIVDGEMDGGPHNVIRPESEWNPEFQIDQPAATLWYHAHPVHMTGSQVYRGLAGLFIIDDEESEKLNLPGDYGLDDIPLIVQDKRFSRSGELIYRSDMNDVVQGMLGDTILVNGVLGPVLEITTLKTRFRILNGANARTFDFRLSDGAAFMQIASDGGLLESPVEMRSLSLSPGERAEIIVDFTKYSPGDTLSLVSTGFKIIEFTVKKQDKGATDLPKNLASISRIPETSAVKTRIFDLMGMGPMVNINGKQMDIKRIDETVKHGDTEIWVIRNTVMGMGMGMGGNIGHPFHYHGVQFQVLSRDNRVPPLNERGWKDTVLVKPNETVKVIARFGHMGLYMYHCHILEHEDAGMMGQFAVK